MIDVAIGTRSGMPAGDQAVALAQLVDKLPNLKLRGVISYDGGAQHIKGFKNRLDQTLNRFAPSLETYERMKRTGLNTEIFSGGGTGTYNILPKVPGVTDVQVGSYIFMDCQYLEIGGESNEEVYTDFAPSLTVVTTVLNTYFPKSITTDAGAKALTLEQAGTVGDRRKGLRLQRGLGRVRRDQVRDRGAVVQGRRQAGADRPALRSGRERIRSDVRDSGRQGRGGVADRRARPLAVTAPLRSRFVVRG